MSKYTTQLRFPIEQTLNDLGLENLEENWDKVYKVLGLDDYPLFDEAYRPTLNNKIIRRYYFREIGFETLAQFRWMMRRTMHEIMPYYNQLYPTQDMVKDPLLGYGRNYRESWDIDGTSKNESINESDSSNTNTTANRNVFQDTPMNNLDRGAIEDMDYATNVTFDNSDYDARSTTNGAASSDGKSHENGWRVHEEDGFNQPQSELLMKYRKTLINIDLEIIDRLGDLFMGLW